jgi:outer membrane protein assembly factor BamB
MRRENLRQWCFFLLTAVPLMTCHRAVLTRPPQTVTVRSQTVLKDLPMRLSWKRKLPASPGPDLAVIDSLLLTATQDGKVFLLDMNTGKIRWKKNFRRKPGLSVLPGDSLFYLFWPAEDLTALALDYLTAHKRWSLSIGGFSDGAVTGHALYVGTVQGGFYAIDPLSGKKLWRHAFSHPVRGVAACGDSLVVVSSEGGEIRCFRANGAQVWQVSFESEFTARPVISRDVLIGSTDGLCRSLSLRDGHVLWQRQLDGGIFRACGKDRESVYWGTAKGFIYRLNAETGAPVWYYQAASVIGTVPLVCGPYILAGLQKEQLIFLNQTNGSCAWQLDVEGRISTTPLIWHQSLLAASEKGWILKFESNNDNLTK